MVKKLTILALITLVHGHAYAQAVFNLVNNVSDLNPERDALTITQGTMRISFTPNNGAPLDLSTAFTPITMRVVHRTDGYTNPVVGSFEISTNSTLVRWNFTFANPGPYRLQADVVFADDTYPIFDRYLTVLPTPSAATVNIALTNDITVNATSTVSLTSQNIQTNISSLNITMPSANITVTGAVTSVNGVTGAVSLTVASTTNSAGVASWNGTQLQIGTNVPSGGGSGNVTINSITNNVFTFVGTNGIVIRTTNNTIQIGQTTIPDSFIGTNRATFTYTGGDQLFTVPAGISNIAIWAWGGGGSGDVGQWLAVGGHSFNVINTFGGEQFSITVGAGGPSQILTNAPAYGSSVYGGGGRGYTTSTTTRVYGGAGGSWVRRLTDSNIVVAAGGAGGNRLNSVAGPYGGGLNGADGGPSTISATAALGGIGGSRTNGGSGFWSLTTVTNAVVMPTAGSFLLGGDGGVRSNGTSASGCGGGGGYYGGGGSLAGVGSTEHSAGGGSGFDGVGISGVVFGSTYRQSGLANQIPMGQDLPFYVSGVGTRATSLTTAGGNGQVTIGY